MKNLCKKLLALLGCTAMLVTSFVMPASATDGETDCITIHAGDYPDLVTVDAEGNEGTYTTATFQNDENGGKFIHLAADESDRNSVEGFKVVLPLNINKTGLYNINLDMCADARAVGNTNYGWASPVKLKVDDGEYFRVKIYQTSDDRNVTASLLDSDLTDKYSADSEKVRWSKYALEPMQLSEGKHTLTFWVYDKPSLQGKDWFVFGLGEINLDLVTDMYEASTRTIHAGNYKYFETVSSDGTKGSFASTIYANSENAGSFIHLAEYATNANTVEGFKVSIPFKVYTDGFYNIDMDMCANVQNTSSDRWNSPVKLKVDDGEYFRVKNYAETDDTDITATVLTASLAEKYSADSEKARWGEYALAEPVELKAGEHTLTYWVYDKPPLQGNDWFVFGLGEINVTPITQLDEISNVTIHAGDYPDLVTVDAEGNEGTYTTATFQNDENGGKFIHLAADESDRNSVEGFKVVVPFKVYSDGEYNIDMDMCAYARSVSSPDYRWASPVKLKIDDGDYFRVKAFSTTDEPDVTATVIDSDLKDKYSADSEKVRWAEYALAEPVELKAGEHTLTYWVYDKPPLQGKDWFVFGLGEINIAPALNYDEMSNITIHAGDYPNFEMEDENGNVGYVSARVFTNIAKTGTFLHFSASASNNGAVNGFKLNIPFRIYKDGAYKINLDMFANSTANAGNVYKWASSPMITVDNGYYFWAKAFATSYDPYVTAKVVDTDLSDRYSYDDNTNEEPLWSEYELKPMELAAGNHTLTIWLQEQAPMQSEVDLFILGLGDINIQPIEECTELVAEGEELVVEEATTVVADDSYSNGRYLSVAYDTIVRKEFYISEAGEYRLTAAANGTAAYAVDENGVNAGDTIILDKGIHELEIQMASGYELDRIAIAPVIDVTAIELADVDVMSLGDTAELKITNQDGAKVTADNVSTVVYESSNEDVVAVDAYGKITAKGMGVATITAGVTSNGNSYTDSVKVTVVGESGLYVSGTTISGNDVSVTLSAASDASASKAIVGVYSVVNGKTTLTDVKIADFDAISAGNSSTKTVSASAIGAEDKVVVFVFDGLDTISPLWSKTIVK